MVCEAGYPPGFSLPAVRTLALTFLVFGSCFFTHAEENTVQLLLEAQPGRGDKMMVAVWLEDKNGHFVETVEICSQAVKHYKELREWSRQRREKEGNKVVAAMVGATIRWGGKRVVEIPAQRNGRNLLDGNHVIRIESARDKGQRFIDFKIPIPKDFKGGTFQHRGYVARATVRVPNGEKPEK